MNVRYNFYDRGRSVSNFAWIPAEYLPYVGLGGGFLYYELDQKGDFIDFKTNDVFPSTVESSGWTPSAHVLAGVDYNLNVWFALTGEARYTWARAGLGSDFSGFDRIDLSGLSTTVGLSVRF